MSGLSPAQVAQRLAGVTATDVAAYTGHHPYRSPMDVFLEKRGEAPPFAGNDRTKWGLLLEDPIRRDYAERHGAFVDVPGTLQHPVDEWALATPDGAVYVGRTGPVGQADRGLEIKCHTIHERWRYGEPGTDEVPLHELIQCTWNMHVSGLGRWDLVTFMDNQPADYPIDRDDELIEMLRDAAQRLRRDLADGTPPPPDGTDGYNNFLRAKYPGHMGDDLIAIDAEDPAVRALRTVTERLAELAEREEQLKQHLKVRIGAKSGLVWKEGGKDRKITWRKSRDGRAVAFDLALRDACGVAALAAGGEADNVRRLALALREGNQGQHDAADLLERLWETLRQLAQEDRFIMPRTSSVPGSRRFCRPRTWKQRKNTEE
jgi:putative phage-type endonuclease